MREEGGGDVGVEGLGWGRRYGGGEKEGWGERGVEWRCLTCAKALAWAASSSSA